MRASAIGFSKLTPVLMKSTFVFLTALFSLSHIASYGQANSKDSLALVQLYDSTQGGNWTNNTNWKTSKPIDTWFGIEIEINASGLHYVTEIILTKNNLSGTIPSSMGNFSRLDSLSLDSNYLVGSIPSSLGNLRILNSLNLSVNQLSGSIPATLNKIVGLNALNLSSNRLTDSIPYSLGVEGFLRYLNLSGNRLSGTLPSSLYDHDSLAAGTFSISDNQFTFAGMENFARRYASGQYAPQANISIVQKDGKLYVSPGGTLGNDTLRWYRDNALYATKVGDTSLTLQTTGKYFVKITNSIATRLTLSSDTVDDSGIPSITDFVPKSGKSGTTVSITGNGLTGAQAVYFGGVKAASFVVNTDGLITAIVDTGSSGSVSVNTPNGIVILDGFTFLHPPSLQAFNPSIGTAGSSINLKGSHFIGTTSVSFGGVAAAAFSVVSDSIITAIVGNGASGDIIIITSYGADTLHGFTYVQSLPVPKIVSYDPSEATAGTVVTIAGSNFTWVTDVSFGGISAASFSVVSLDTIRAVIGTGASGDVIVTSPYGADTGYNFKYILSLPTPLITSFTPSSAGMGDVITIKGSHFSGVTSVRFGGVLSPSYTVITDSTVTATVGAGASGFVTIAWPMGVDSLAGFNFIDLIASPKFELLQFVGSFSANQIKLVWLTDHEGSISKYIIEHSPDSIVFSPIGNLGAGSKDSGINTYIFMDSMARTGLNYYQLKIQDTAGNYTYSNIIAVQAGKAHTLSIYPNPSDGYLKTQIPNTLVASSLQLIDLQGRAVKTIQVNKNVPEVKVDLTGIPKGVYKLIWSDGTNYSFQTVLIMRP
ncbi:MAG TPA: IPT/TIG domain-containing protein [Puia sp.]|nr:IPT/TIG domain-containing protein [Puia sp.]